MKTKTLLLALAIIASLTFASHAAIPHVINFQGKATDMAGAPLDGAYVLTIRIYDAQTGGNKEWEEVHSAVQITNGIFQALLGSVTALDLDFKKEYWISVQIDSDSEMSPRTRFASVGYAYTAQYAYEVGGEQIPSGVIVMWSGNIANIPAGWALCDGTNGTPDLRDRFIVGARQDENSVAKTNVKGILQQAGGEHEHTLTIDEMPAHTHPITAYRGGQNVYSHQLDAWTNQAAIGTATTNATGGGGAHNSTPPFYALAFIIKS